MAQKDHLVLHVLGVEIKWTGSKPFNHEKVLNSCLHSPGQAHSNPDKSGETPPMCEQYPDLIQMIFSDTTRVSR